MVAKTDTAHWRLAHQFEHRKVRKVYLAVVHGTLDLDADVIDIPLGRHPHVREKYAARPESGKSAITRYELQKQYGGYALVRLMPKTGRTHQLRVHMSLMKHPVVADIMYGGKLMTMSQMAKGADLPGPEEPGGNLKPDDVVINRQALHAAEIYLSHPVSGKEICIKAPLPCDMQLLVKLLERYRKN